MIHKICHVEIVSHDLEGTKDFYSKVFNWQCSDMMPNYGGWVPGEGELGGGFRVEEKGPDMQKTLIYIHVENIDQSMEQIMANGGTQVMPKTKISDEHGSFALFLDPSGTCVGIWSQE
ncbi:VOC family protein [bacterium]|nr:VOC family protein [bacterium]